MKPCDIIRQNIANHVKEQFTSGVGVPTTKELAEKFSVTQPTVIKALKENNIDILSLRRQFKEAKPQPVAQKPEAKPIPPDHVQKELKPEEKYAETSDVRAAYLYFSGCVPLYTEMKTYDGHPRTAFVFEKSDRLARLVMDYKGSPANRFANCIISFRKMASMRTNTNEHGPIPSEFFNLINRI